MILLYVYNIVKFKKWRLLLFVILSIFCLKFVAIVTIFRPDVNQLLELHNCPACYGVSACDYIRKVDVTPYDLLSAFSYLIGVKNVFFGVLDGRKVVLKKLAHSSELDEFDGMLCKNEKLSHLCTEYTESNNQWDTNFYKLIENEVTLDFAKDDVSRLRVCPTTRHLNNLLQPVYNNHKTIDRVVLYTNIWTLVTLNPEPLLLQILSTDEGWPVPTYLGACGRVVLEEYIGLPLTAYYNEPWLLRAQIASSLLSAAYMFTFGSNDFGFYLTDISADNIAVDSHNIAKFVDLENVIVVDKNSFPQERSAQWDEVHENKENINCSSCLIFSSVDICNHKLSDHNYYAICQLLALNPNNDLLPGGLLHDIPADILHQYPNIKYLMKQCAVNEAPNTRINSGFQLKKLLHRILEKV